MIIHYCMEMFNVQSPCHAIIKRECKLLYNIVTSYCGKIVKISLKRNCVAILTPTMRNTNYFELIGFSLRFSSLM